MHAQRSGTTHMRASGGTARERLLAECEGMGLVERDQEGGWRLTDWAERKFGNALRGLSESEVRDEVLAA